jgi:hypothetical protein
MQAGNRELRAMVNEFAHFGVRNGVTIKEGWINFGDPPPFKEFLKYHRSKFNPPVGLRNR